MLEGFLKSAAKKAWSLADQERARQIASNLENLDYPDLPLSPFLLGSLTQRNYAETYGKIEQAEGEGSYRPNPDQMIRDLAHVVAAVYPNEILSDSDKPMPQFLEEVSSKLIQKSSNGTHEAVDEVWRFLWGKYNSERVKGITHNRTFSTPRAYLLEQLIFLDTLKTLANTNDRADWVGLEIDACREQMADLDEEINADWKRGKFAWSKYEQSGCLLVFCLGLSGLSLVLHLVA